jgi:multiple sugar transport system permease protein
MTTTNPGTGPARPKDTAVAGRRRGRRPDRAAWGFLLPFVALFAFTFAAPVCYALYQSVLTVRRSGPLGLGAGRIAFGGFANYALALRQADFLESFGRVLLFGVVLVPVMLALSTLLALLLDVASRRWAQFFRTAYFLPYGVPGVIASVLWGFLYVPGVSPISDLLGRVGLAPDFLGYGGVLWSIANIVIWEFAGYNMLVLTAQLQSIPPELTESARIDGANARQIAWHVKLPLIRPALVLTCVFSIIGTLQLFVEPLVLKPLTSAISNHYTPNLAAYNEAFANDNVHLAAAESVLLAVVACVLSFGFLSLVNRGTGRSRR